MIMHGSVNLLGPNFKYVSKLQLKHMKLGRTVLDTMYLKLTSPLNAAICTTTHLERQKCYGPDKKIIFRKPLFELEVKGQGPTKVIMVCNTSPYGHTPTYQISLTYLERQKCYGPNKKILFKKQLYLEVKGQGHTKVITVCDTPPYGHAPTYQINII